MVVLKNPTVGEAVPHLKRAISERKAILLVGNCWVNYRGRASSRLEPGERIVIVKGDGSILVHRPTGYEPVNWQPPGCILHISELDGVLRIRAVRRRPAETVNIFFDRIYLLSTLTLTDRGEFSLYASEEDMQRAILLNPSLIEPGFKPVSFEKRVEPGFIDVYGIDREGRFVVVEIKRKTAGREAALQLARYVESVRGMVNREVRGILVAPTLAKGVQRLLASLNLDFKALSPKRCAEVLSRSETRKLSEFLRSEGRGA